MIIGDADASRQGVSDSGIGSSAAAGEAGFDDGRTRARDLVVDGLLVEKLVVADIEGRRSIGEGRGSVESGGSRASASSEFTIVGIASARRSDRSSIEFASGSDRDLRDGLESATDGATEGGGSIIEGAVNDLGCSAIRRECIGR